jgi:hypothetical protein
MSREELEAKAWAGLHGYLAGQVTGAEAAEGIHDLLIALEKSGTPPTPTTPSISGLPPYSVKWTPFTKGTGLWTFANDPAVKDLVMKLASAKNKTLEEDGFRYRLSGDGDRFLQAFPTKKGKGT